MSRMLLWFSKQSPIGIVAGAIVPAGALQLVDIDLVGMGSSLLLDLPGVLDWPGSWFGSLL